MITRRVQLVIRTVFIMIPVVVFFWLLAKDFVVSGTLVAEMDFSRPSPFIRDLRLPIAVSPIAYDSIRGDYTQRITGNSVTFSVRLPRRFERARVELWYQKNPTQELRLGMQRRKATISAELHDLIEAGTDGVWTIGTTTFDHLEQFDFSNQWYQFLVRAPGLQQSPEGITVTLIRITFEREPWTRDNFFPRVWNFFKGK